MRTKLFRILLLSLVFSGLVGCGYHLKGTGESLLAGSSLEVITESPYGDFEKQFFRRLKAREINLVNDGTALHRLVLIDVKSLEQGVSRDETGRANEIILTLELSFRFGQKAVAIDDLPWQTIKESATYAFDYRDPVAQKNQQKEALAWLHQRLADRLLQRLEKQLRTL